MISYILKRLLLILPTLFGIMLINFLLVQFVPGGPIEQIINNLENDNSFLDNLGGGNTENLEDNDTSVYKGSKGLPKEFIHELEVQFGFDKPPIKRFQEMFMNYLTFDFIFHKP